MSQRALYLSVLLIAMVSATVPVWAAEAPECAPLMVIDQNELAEALRLSIELLTISFAVTAALAGWGGCAVWHVGKVIATRIRMRKASAPFADRAAHYRLVKARHVALLVRISARMEREAARTST